jgi:hypothetical protein
MYRFKEDINWTAHFWFDGQLIKKMIWAKLPKASKSIYPVIACHRNEKGIAYPGERTIAILSGRTDKTVRNGIRALDGLYNIKITNYITSRGRRSRKFFIAAPPRVPGRAFPFYKCLLEKGLWQALNPTAQALYPVMRHFGFFEGDTYRLYQDPGYSDDNFDSVYRERDFDFCEAEPLQLALHAGISRQSLAPALEDLLACDLIEALDRDPGGHVFLWKVFFKTQSWFPRDALNKKIEERYGGQ